MYGHEVTPLNGCRCFNCRSAPQHFDEFPTISLFRGKIPAMLSSLLALTALLPSALAHGGVLSYNIGGTTYQGWSPYNTPTGQTTIQRPWATYNPILSATDPTLACNDDGTAGALQLTAAAVPAGTKVIAYWNQVWPHPYGPMLTYLAQCPSSGCTGVNASTLKWFKIDQSGLINGTVFNGYWGSGKMIDQNSSWTTTIPSTVPAGNYMIRFETIALHSLPAQFYPECAQIVITGSGSLAPTAAQLVTFPGGYSNSDPGLTIDIYSNAAQSQTTYPMPGPPLYGSSSSGTTVGGGTTTKVSSTTVKGSSTSSAVSPPPSSGTVAQYGQCGGSGYTGPTGCVSPYKCTVVNTYYSQCL
ncbi:Cellulose-growth-specific protein [Mycena indigotica]|uniref:AA9 family lytic polysaccharide monooxygenase n=1 Tax=Mycena indigotica TaxID=2126181 RepID=A0A8H6T7P0_9AGAR|nr:Cellulose-growth-specific protein [Mycena indigotica]KAF7312304.1 Cellulose-growth-specific protein [Mycena indigotica]